MRLLAAHVLGLTIGIVATTYARRYIGAFLWWLFTQDLRGSR